MKQIARKIQLFKYARMEKRFGCMALAQAKLLRFDYKCCQQNFPY